MAVLLAAACGKPTCPPGDLECVWASVTVFDVTADLSGPKLTLYAVDTGPLSALGARDRSPDGGRNANREFQVTLPATTTHDSAQESTVIALLWKDPAGCRPAFCYTPCPRGVRCLSASRCTPSIDDGAFTGVTMHRVEYSKAPEATLDFELDVTPVSTPGCGTDVTGLLAAFSPAVLVGTTGLTQVHLPGTRGGDGASGGGGAGGGTGGGCDGVVGTLSSCLPGASPNSCACNGSTTPVCVAASEFRNLGLPVPSACLGPGQTGCWDAATNAIASPCCSGSCRVARSCGAGATGTCQ